MTTAVQEVQTRDARQQTLVPPQKLALCRGVVVGVGAIGRQVAIQVAALGIPRLTLIDPDEVEILNLGPQAYAPQDVGTAKVVATGSLLRFLNPDVNVEVHRERFRESNAGRYLQGDEHRVLFCCVDSMEARKFIWETAKASGKVDLFLDARAAGETVRTFAVADLTGDTGYAQTLFSDDQAYQGSCTARMTIYLGTLAASLLVAQFARWLRDLPVDADVLCNLLASEMGPT